MSSYHFDLLPPHDAPPLLDAPLSDRPCVKQPRSLAADAKYYVPSEDLIVAINTAIAVGEPLLITGEPGTGKTSAAYYCAARLGLGEVLHFQAKSESEARDALYHFDSVGHFHDSHLAHDRKLEKSGYVELRALGEAIASETTRVVVIDEIDKARSDFPNDLLHELDQMAFTITETNKVVQAAPGVRPIVFITSNSERRLPEPFLRRCLYHHIEFDEAMAQKAVTARRELFDPLDDGIIQLAMERFLRFRGRPLRKVPSTGELLTWLRVLASAAGTYPSDLSRNLGELPFLGCLIKDKSDLEEIRKSGPTR